MAINPTRNLPSFSEMYSAFKNRGGLGETLQTGVNAFNSGMEAAGKAKLQAAETKKAEAEAKKASMPKSEGVVRIDQIVDPKEKADLLQYAQPNDQGLLVVPISTYSAVTKRGMGQETLDLKTQLAEQAAKAQTEAAANQARLAKVAEEKAALQATLGPQAQALTAASRLAEEAGKVGAPTMLQRGVSFVKEAVTGEPLASVLAERQGKAARQKLSEIGGVNPVDEATGINVPAPSLPTVNTTEEYNALPPGSRYQDSYGNIATKPAKKRTK